MSFKWRLLALAITCGLPVITAANACVPAQGKDPACHQSPDEQVRQAMALNTDRRYIEAADLLEHLLMQYPETRGALAQYNRALSGIYSQNAAPPTPTTRQDVPPQQWKINTGLQLRSGYSSNLNQAPTSSTVQLTLPSGPIALNLLPQFQQQGGVGGEALLSANAMRSIAGNLQWQVKGDLFGRETGNGGYADYQGANLLTSLMRHSDNGTETGAALGFNALHYDANTYLFAGQLMLRHTEKKGRYCKPQMGADLLWQRQQSNPLLDSHYTGLMGGFLCDTPLGFYNAALSAGWDWASDLRPGGDQARAKLDLTGIWTTPFISPTSFIKAYASYQESVDMQAYSVLLNYGATRRLNRLGLGIDYDWPLPLIANNWRGVASVKWQNQNSNISLFTMDTLEGWLCVRIAW